MNILQNTDLDKIADSISKKNFAKAENPEKKKRSLKLWEIDTAYHCSIIGTCLSLGELRRIVKKCGFSITKESFDYEIHSIGVKYSYKKCPLSKLIHKKLKQKFRKIEQRYAKATNEKDLFYLWQEDAQKGDIAGAYWAVLSHPKLTDKVQSHVFGEVHILSHLVGASNRADIQKLSELEKTCASYEYDIEEKQIEIDTLDIAKKGLSEKQKEAEQKRIKLEQELSSTTKRIAKLESGTELRHLKNQVKSLDSQAQLDKARIKHSEENILQTQKELKQERLKTHSLEKSLSHREQELKIRTEECIAAEEQLLFHISKHLKNSCDNSGKASCPGPELCGKRILYVGGHTNLIRHYKELIELSGGEFIHHDGGVEDAKKRLNSLIVQADVLICPIDCISHDACLRVKKHCKQLDKQFVTLRSSGVSSLARGLGQIS